MSDADPARRPDVLRDWVLESYRAVAPKKLVRELDAAGSTLRA